MRPPELRDDDGVPDDDELRRWPLRVVKLGARLPDPWVTARRP